MARIRGQYEEDESEISLIPIMGLLVILIPMLLLMVVFTKIGVININAPKLSVGPATDEPEDDEKKPLNLTIGISDKGYTIAATGGVLPGQEPADPAAPPDPNAGPTLPSSSGGACGSAINDEGRPLCPRDGVVCPQECGDGNVCKDRRCLMWDYVALYNRMVEIKEAYQDETVVNMGADDRVKFGTLVATMDAVRIRLKEDKYNDQETFETAEVKMDKDDRPVLLFNDVVMAVIQ
jgi:biopolymer transport protein ExbD